jgi:hypothetical protein
MTALETQPGEGVRRGDEGGGGAAEGDIARTGEVVVGGDEGGGEEAVVVDGLEAGRGADGGGVGDAPAQAAFQGGVGEQLVGAGFDLAPESPCV